MDPSTRAWIAAGLLAVAALALVVMGQLPSAIPLAAGAAAITLLVVERSAPPELPGQASLGGQRATARLAQELELHGRGIHVPPQETTSTTRLFVPARDASAEEIPTLQEELTIHRAPPGVLGLCLDPPGAGLEAAWEGVHGLPRGRGSEEAALHIRRALDQLGLGRQVTVHAAQRHLRVAYEHTALGQLCRESRTQLAPWDVQGGCPTCSLIAGLVARAHQAPVAMVACQGLEGGRVQLELEVLRSS